MYRVIIVDDEPIIRSAVRTFINWESLHCVLVGEFSNGLDALQFLETNTIDMVITDIKMPELSGIELAQKLKTLYPHMKVIILTGYADFSYAQSAIHSQVDRYIVKTDIEEQLPSAITSCIQSLECTALNNQSTATSQKAPTTIDFNHFTKQLKASLTTLDDAPSIAQDSVTYFYPQATQYLVVSYQLFDPENRLDGPIASSTSMSTISAFIESALENLSSVVFSKSKNELVSILFVDDTFSMDKLLLDLHAIIKLTTTFKKLHLLIGVSKLEGDYSHLNTTYLSAVEALSNDYFKVKDTLYRFKSGKPHPIAFDYSNFSFNLLATLRANDLPGSLEHLFNLFKAFDAHYETLDYIKHESILLFSSLLKLVGNCRDALQTKQVLKSSAYTSSFIASATTPLPIYLILRLALTEIVDLLHTSESNGDFIVKQVNQFIYTQYHTDITLQKIADELHINSNYLSNLYSTKTGLSFTKALNQHRIEVSKELLRTKPLKIFKIGELVGIPEPGYFSHVFTKYTGMSPQSYRKHIS